MNNRVDYLSDKLVHLRGKLKPVSEVVPPIAANSSEPGAAERPVEPPPDKCQDARKRQALELRSEQTRQLYSDLEQRMARRLAQLAARRAELDAERGRLDALADDLRRRAAELTSLQPTDEAAADLVKLGECYRALDRKRLDFFTVDAAAEAALHGSPASPESVVPPPATFRQQLQSGAALALTLGMTIAAGLLLAALILYWAWR